MYFKSKKYFRVTRITLICILILALDVPLILASPFDLDISDPEKLEEYISSRDQRIVADPRNPSLYIERGNARFLAHYFNAAISDYTKALSLDNTLSEAYLGRGLALGRAGKIDQGIEDLDVYIRQNPKSSFAYTKRGVRYLWLGKHEKARLDYEKALELDPENAEAHDDLGVVYAQQKQFDEAADHFMSAIEIDPSYQKAYFNMALVSYLSSSNQQALIFITNALALAQTRDALILKAKILESMGRAEEAVSILDQAQQLPDKDWSEKAPLQ